MRILFVSANPDWEPCLDLLDELRELNQSLKGKKYKLELLPAAQPDDLRQAIDGSDTEIDILHFSGHATEEDGLLFRHNRGDSEPLTAGDLTTMFGEKSVKLAVLNACNTESIANEITGFAKNVIGTTAKLEDISAKKFTKVLYASLGNGKSIDEAFEDVGQTFDKTGLTNIYERIRSPHWDPEEITFAAGDLETDQENVDAWNRYFYEGYLKKQIKSVEETIERDKKWTWGVLGLAGLLTCVLLYLHPLDFKAFFWFLPDFLTGQGDPRLLGYQEWIGYDDARNIAHSDWVSYGDTSTDALRTRAYEAWVNFSGEHMLESLTKFGTTALPALFASLKGFLVIRGKAERRSLTQLLELVKSSADLPPNIREKLFSILEQNMFGALSMINPRSQEEEAK